MANGKSIASRNKGYVRYSKKLVIHKVAVLHTLLNKTSFKMKSMEFGVCKKATRYNRKALS